MGAFIDTSFTSLIADIVPMRIRGRYFSARQRMTMISGIVAGVVMSWLLDRFTADGSLAGYTIVFILAGIFGAGDIACFFWVSWPPMPEPHQGQEKESFPTITSTSITDVQLVKDGTTIDMEKEVTQEPATEEETTENASEEAETGSEVSEEETTKAVSDSTEEGLTEEESTVEMVDVTHWVFTQDNKTQRVDESDDIHDLLVNMVGLTFNDCADYYADEEEKESYGLTDGAAVLTITYQSGEEETTLKLTIGATTEDDAYYYVSMDDSDQVNTVSKESLDAVLDAISKYGM